MVRRKKTDENKLQDETAKTLCMAKKTANKNVNHKNRNENKNPQFVCFRIVRKRLSIVLGRTSRSA